MTEALGNTLAAASAAITGEGTPEAVRVLQREDRLSILGRNLAGPVLSVMLAGVIWTLSWGVRRGLWTTQTEALRAQMVGWIGMILALLLGLLVWRIAGGRPGRIEVKAGPAEVILDSNGAPT
jgi:hypothetical protein